MNVQSKLVCGGHATQPPEGLEDIISEQQYYNIHVVLCVMSDQELLITY